MSKKKVIKYLSTIVCGVTLLSTVAGCSKKETNTKESTTAESSTPTTISIMTPLMGTQPPKTDGNTIYEKMAKTTNAKLDIEFVPSASFKDKLNVAIASNKLPMVTVVDGGNTKTTNIVNGVKSGMFWEVGSLLKDYPNLSKFYSNQTVIDNSLIEGKLYGLPRPRVLARVGLVVRQDWLDNLGLKAPSTPEEVYNVAKAFTLNDPDKNGKADTYGLEYADISTGSYGWNGISTLTVALGGFNEFGLKDGKMVPDYTTKEYLDGLKVLNRMYKENYMNKDFPLVTGSKRYDVFDQGKVGMIFCTIDDSINRQNLYKAVPTAKLSIAPVLSGPNGQKMPATAGQNGLLMFSKTSVKTEAELKKILSFYDKMTSTEMIDLLTYGVEGVHYTVENGAKKPAADTSLLSNDASEFTMFLPRPALVETPTDTDITKAVNAAFKANEKYIVNNPTLTYSSATRNEKGGDLDKLIMDARIKFVMGELDEAGFNKAIEDWRSRGGDKIISEMTEQYNTLGKK
jgi:putative aldouronate transport system substrate-binding protein